MVQLKSKKIKKISEDFDIEISEKAPSKRKTVDDFGYARYMNIGFYLITPLMTGVFLGLWIDKRFHIEPVGIISGIAFGTVSTLYNLIKLTKQK